MNVGGLANVQMAVTLACFCALLALRPCVRCPALTPGQGCFRHPPWWGRRRRHGGGRVWRSEFAHAARQCRKFEGRTTPTISQMTILQRLPRTFVLHLSTSPVPRRANIGHRGQRVDAAIQPSLDHRAMRIRLSRALGRFSSLGPRFPRH